MSWLERLYQTYNNCSEHIGKFNLNSRLLPICHTTQNAHIEVVINEEGIFKRARVIPKTEAPTDIPCTEDSGGRTGSKPTCHPLCDKLQYVAGDFLEFGGDVTSGFAKTPDEPHRMYLETLSKWCASPFKHRKVDAVYAYVKRGTLIADLCAVNILPQDSASGKLLKEWKGLSVDSPTIFGVLPKGNAPEEAFVRWVVELSGDLQPELWLDTTVWQSWTKYDLSNKSFLGLCYVTGEIVPLARQHPARLRNGADKAKLISSNDDSGFTFRGRFTDSTGMQACGVGFEITQKAHNALRWLIARQGYRNGTQAIVAWSVGGESVPDLFADSWDLFSEKMNGKLSQDQAVDLPSSNNNAAQNFALRLKRKISGYKAELGNTTSIVVLGVDAATTGRLSIIYYRELTASEFLQRIEAWHKECCWVQNYDKKLFIGAPAPQDIARTAYGQNIDEKLCNSIIRELLACIIDSAPLPIHIVECCVRRASNRHGIEPREWEKSLGIACALYCKHTKNERNYQMALEITRTSRDYLYGRLLAIAERLEEVALSLAGEKRETNAGKYMQRFADNPYSTWLTIELSLKPYEVRLRNARGGFLHNIKVEMDTVMTAFNRDDFILNTKLSGEFLLGYHCQRAALRPPKELKDTNEIVEASCASN